MSHDEKLAAACPIMAKLVAAHGPCPLPTREDHGPYEALFRAIVFQQLSGKAAGTILKRVLMLFGSETDIPAPEEFLTRTDEELRACGLSRQKIAALKDLAVHRINGIVPQGAEFESLGDEEIISRLTQVRGVGRWTVEMYLMFTAGRLNVWPVDDLGVRKGWMIAYGLKEMPKPKVFASMADHLAPYRSLAAWYCWRATDTATPDALVKPT